MMKPFKDLKAELLQNPEVRAAYERLRPEFELAQTIIAARAEDAQRIDAHGLFIQRARLPLSLRRANPADEEFATIRAELARRGQAAP